jgi:hypothetical protein
MNCETTYYTAADSCGDTTELDDAMSQCYEVEGSFGCGDGTTIDISMVCDGSADCPDGEDELGCAAGRAAVHLMRLR